MRTTAQKSPRPLHGRDLILYRFGIGLLVMAGVVLGLLLFVYFGVFHGDFLTFDGALEAAGGTLGAIATTLAAIGSALLFVVSLRVQARELQHSIQELKESVAAQKDAAENHKRALAVADRQLSIAKQEKEFNVCLVALEEARKQLHAFKHNEFTGSDAIHSIMIDWMQLFQEERINDPKHLSLLRQALGGPDYALGFLMPHADEIRTLRVKLYWVLDSVLDDSPFRKELDDRDARFIRSLVIPMVEEVSTAVVDNLSFL